jgi:NADPH:quinone reductase-like Zn-dependent oxidoreductase
LRSNSFDLGGKDRILAPPVDERVHAYTSGYDVVLNSLGKNTLEKSLRVLKPGGKLISISGPPDVAFAKENGSNWLLQQVMRLLSFGIRKKAKHHGVSYSFVFMRANGEQLRKITSLIESGFIRQVMARVFPFETTKETLAYLETGRAKGKVVIKVRENRGLPQVQSAWLTQKYRALAAFVLI